MPTQETYEIDRPFIQKLLARWRFLIQEDIDLLEYILKKPEGSMMCGRHYKAFRRIRREAGYLYNGKPAW